MSNFEHLKQSYTPGPWKITENYGGYTIHSDFDQQSDICDIITKTWEGIPVIEKCSANAHLISAAPQAVEFISDFLAVMDSIAGVTPELAQLIDKGEEILKKAYNF